MGDLARNMREFLSRYLSPAWVQGGRGSAATTSRGLTHTGNGGGQPGPKSGQSSDANLDGLVDDEAARGDAMVLQDDPHTGPQELVPGNLAVAKHPRQGGHRIRAKAGAFKTRPANRVGHQHGGDTKREPSPLRDGHRVMGLMHANSGVNGGNKGTHAGGRLGNHHPYLQAIGGWAA